jgi:hypothetical protein
MALGLTMGMRATLAIEVVIALLFLLFGWGESYRNSVGRGPALSDILAISLPLILVIAAILGAGAAARKGNGSMAWLVVLAPLPVAILLAMLAGAV